MRRQTASVPRLRPCRPLRDLADLRDADVAARPCDLAAAAAGLAVIHDGGQSCDGLGSRLRPLSVGFRKSRVSDEGALVGVERVPSETIVAAVRHVGAASPVGLRCI